jgi:hypothetical protein
MHLQRTLQNTGRFVFHWSVTCERAVLAALVGLVVFGCTICRDEKDNGEAHF